MDRFAALAAFRRSHPFRRTRVDGVEWEYIRTESDGPNLLIIPGGALVAEWCFPLVEMFERDYSTITISHPPLATMAERVSGLLTLLRAEGIERTYVHGQSFGGMLAQCLVAAAPKLVAKLVLANTGAACPALADNFSSTRLLTLPDDDLKAALAREYNRLVAPGPRDGDFWCETLREVFRERLSGDDLRAFLRSGNDFATGYTERLDLKQWAGDALIVGSDDDAMFMKYGNEHLARLFSTSRTHIFKGAGHTPPISRPEEYRRLIAEFLGAST